jgi:hypothetical protein
MRKDVTPPALLAAMPGLPDVAARKDALSWARSPVQLSCPCCGRSKTLQDTRDWPPGLKQIQARCPDCSGHGHDSTVLTYADGRVVTEHSRAH